MSEGTVVALVVPRSLVKTVKSVLEEGGRSGRRIVRGGNVGGGGGVNHDEELFTVFTNLAVNNSSEGEKGNYWNYSTDIEILRTLNLEPHSLLIAISITTPAAPPPTPRNPLDSFLTSFLHSHLPPSEIPPLLATAPKRYSLYPPLALLPPNSFTSPPWQHFLSSLPPTTLTSFHAHIAHSLSATHLATNSPISASSPLRSPTLTPLHGDFGPLCTSTTPTPSDLTSAFWCTTTQHGIFQTWAPMYTMFSRGNITEKARVLTFPDIAGRTVVDLYAGIGYFAFSYAKAGAATVWCWEINPWSCEALLRGAVENGWSVKLVRGGEEVQREDVEGVGIVVFMEDNVAAGRRVERMGGEEEVRHVNLGLLPTSRGSWGTAVRVLGRRGWVHVHGNVGAGEVEGWGEEVVGEFGALDGREVRCVHVEEVKTFAPGVVHCVLDLYIGEGEDV